MGRLVEYRRGPITEWYLNEERGPRAGIHGRDVARGRGAAVARPVDWRRALHAGSAQRARRAVQGCRGRRGSPLHRAQGVGRRRAGARSLARTRGQSTFDPGRGRGIRVPGAHRPWIKTEEAKLTAGEPQAYCGFGGSVSLSGDTALVGAAGENHADGLQMGAAYVFVRNGTSWVEQARLIASDPAIFRRLRRLREPFGRNGCGRSPESDSAARMRARPTCSFAAGPRGPSRRSSPPAIAAANDDFGISVSLSGDTALVGAKLDDHAGSADAGSAYVFVRSGASWSEQAKLTASDAAANDYFGDVSLSDDTALVGAMHADHAGGTGAGSAYVFVRSGTSWAEQAKLIASDAAGNDTFGNSVSLSSDTAVVGTPGDDLRFHAGSAYVFVRSGISWTEQDEAHRQRSRRPARVRRLRESFGPHGRGRSRYSATTRAAWMRARPTCSSQRNQLERAERSSSPAIRPPPTTSAAPSASRAPRPGRGPCDDFDGGGRGFGLRVSALAPASDLLHGRHVGQRLPGGALRQRHSRAQRSARLRPPGRHRRGSEGRPLLLRHQRPAGQPLGQRHELPVRCATDQALRALAGTGTLGACDGAFMQDLNATLVSRMPHSLEEPRRRRHRSRRSSGTATR